MSNKSAYSFDDEVVSAFLYDIKNSRIEVHFDSYYDLVKRTVESIIYDFTNLFPYAMISIQGTNKPESGCIR